MSDHDDEVLPAELLGDGPVGDGTDSTDGTDDTDRPVPTAESAETAGTAETAESGEVADVTPDALLDPATVAAMQGAVDDPAPGGPAPTEPDGSAPGEPDRSIPAEPGGPASAEPDRPAPERGRHAGEPADERVIEHDADEPSRRVEPVEPAAPVEPVEPVGPAQPVEPAADHAEPELVGEAYAPPPPTVTHLPAPEGVAVLPAGAPSPTHILPAAETTVGLRRQRREERRRRSRRNRVVVVSLVVVAALVAGLVTYFSSRGKDRPATAGSSQQQTLLVGIAGADGRAASVALIGVDGAGHADTLLVPQSTIVDGPGNTVGGSYAISPTGEFAGAVSDLVGVRVDATWRLSQAGLAALVTQLGGVQVDVDKTVSAPGLALEPGQQQLSGQQAAAFATYLGSDPEQERANRFSLVLGGVLAKLPRQSELVPLLASLAQYSSSTWTSQQLATYLSALAADQGGATQQTLPVTTLDTGGDTPTYALDATAAPGVVSSLFPAALLPGHGDVGTRVQVINDSGRPGLTTPVRAQLTAAGLTFVRAVNSSPFHQYAKTSVIVFDSSAASLAFGHRVAAAIGLPNAPVLVGKTKPTVADAYAVLADDYPG